MAAKKQVTAADTKSVAPIAVSRPSDSEYSIDELAANARKLFGTSPECVKAALKVSGARRATVQMAKSLINKFLSMEVN